MSHIRIVALVLGVLAAAAVSAACTSEDAETNATHESELAQQLTNPMGSGPTVAPTTLAPPSPNLPPISEESLRDPEILVVKPLPVGLDPDRATDQLLEEQVVELWTTFFMDSFVELDAGRRFHFCSGGVAMSANPEYSAALIATGVSNSWHIDSPSAAAASEWWEARLTARSGVADRFFTLSLLGVIAGEPSMTVETVQKPVTVYQSEYCTQVVNEQVREIPQLLLSDNPPNPAVQVSLWMEYLQGGILRSVDGKHSLEICTGTDDTLKGIATGTLLSEELLDGDRWGAAPQLALPGSGWDHTGLVFLHKGEGIPPALLGYNLEVTDGGPALVHNPDASHPFVRAGAPNWVEPVIKVVPFEVIEGADCAPSFPG